MQKTIIYHYFFYRNAMVHALTHSRPPSYKSHMSDHPIIESGGNNTVTTVTNTVNTGSVRTSTGLNSTGQSQVQVAQIHNVPRTPPDHSVHSVHSVGSNQRLNTDTSGQDVSIVPVSNPADKTGFNPDLDDFHHYHIKIGENQDLCSDTDYELFDNNHSKKDEEKRSVVTIVQTSTTSNSSPVIVTVSGSGIGESGESGSEFSDIRASPAEVEILATL